MGVGLANQLMAPGGRHLRRGLGPGDTVFSALFWSPLIGFVCSALLLLVMKPLCATRHFTRRPRPTQPPPLWIRGLLILTCTGVSLAHGGNDGQKGMGLIMLILIGAAPTAYALNRTMPDNATPAFISATARPQAVFASPCRRPGRCLQQSRAQDGG